MYTAGCDIGSLTAKAVILSNDEVVADKIIPVRPSPAESALLVMEQVLLDAAIDFDDLSCICATGYGRMEIPFADMNMSEISCHGLGAWKACRSVRTIIDIGGQDCKAIAVDSFGRVTDFVMNDKCAAGTGRSLEMLARTLDVPLAGLGRLARRSRKPVAISSRCGIFMELEVLDALYRRRKIKDIARGITEAVAERACALAAGIPLAGDLCITGGVSKNSAVVASLEERLGLKAVRLPLDHQLIGAYGAACFARESCREKTAGETVQC